MWVFSFVDMVYHIRLCILKPSLWPWDESSLVMVFDVLLDLVC